MKDQEISSKPKKMILNYYTQGEIDKTENLIRDLFRGDIRAISLAKTMLLSSTYEDTSEFDKGRLTGFLEAYGLKYTLTYHGAEVRVSKIGSSEGLFHVLRSCGLFVPRPYCPQS